MQKSSFVFVLLAGVLVTGATTRAAAGDKVNVLVLRENGIGSAAQAQPHVDKLIQLAAKKNGWPAAKGKYITKRKRAKKYISKKSPKFGMVTLGAYLALRKGTGMEVLGSVKLTRGGGERYFVVSKSGSDLSACKGKKLATNHARDRGFFNKVISGGAFTDSDFELVKTRRPVQTLKKVIRDQASCALIDDAQRAELSHVDGGSALKTVWSSARLPPMAVVAFPTSSAGERSKFKSTLGSLCSGSAKRYCDKVGIVALQPASESAYRGVISQYGH